jgi:hypothetical protein
VAAAVVFSHLNEVLGDTTLEEYAQAQAAVEAADTVRDALEAFGAIDELTDREAAEARAVLDALPAAVDEAIIAAVENAFERQVPLVLEWVERADGPIEVRVSEEPHRDGVRVRIKFVSPDGATFVV